MPINAGDHLWRRTVKNRLRKRVIVLYGRSFDFGSPDFDYEENRLVGIRKHSTPLTLLAPLARRNGGDSSNRRKGISLFATQLHFLLRTFAVEKKNVTLIIHRKISFMH